MYLVAGAVHVEVAVIDHMRTCQLTAVLGPGPPSPTRLSVPAL